MDPNNPTNDQQQMGQMSSTNPQVSADNSQMPSDNYQVPMVSQEPAQVAPVAGGVTPEPSAMSVTPQEEVAEDATQFSGAESGQQMMSEPVQVSQEVPEQVNPIDASQYSSPTVSTVGTTSLGSEPSGGDNNPPQAA